MKTKTILILLLATLSVTACENPEDPTALYLMSIAGASASGPAEGTYTTEYSVEAEDVTGSDDFIFQTTKTIGVFVQISEFMEPVSDVLVQVTDLQNGDRVLYRGVTTSDGSINGSFTIDTNTRLVALEVMINGETLYFEVNIENVQVIRRYLFITGSVNPVEAPIVDTDGDGIVDELDQFPDDPTRASTIRIPSESYYTVAFEDLYPKKGDADFNDYVVRLVHEEDLNAAGEVVRNRGIYTHVARGAGYKHRLKLNVGQALSGQVNIQLSGANLACAEKNLNYHSADLQGIELYPDCKSNQTILDRNGGFSQMANTSAAESFKVGMQSSLEIVLDQPINKQSLGSAPYDLFLHVINTGKEIHFAGRYFQNDGSDRYLDSDGFPWALMIPGEWSWPLERKRINNGYELFKPWYESEGLENRDWYSFSTAEYLFNF